jgi:CspA family cold shock protein
MNKVHKGKTIWFNGGKGIGFLSWEIDGIPQKDMFVHYSDLAMEGYKTLEKDQAVLFEIGENKRGEPKAINVTIVK